MSSPSLMKCCGELPESLGVRNSVGGGLERWPRNALKCRVCGRKVEQYASDLHAKWNAALGAASPPAQAEQNAALVEAATQAIDETIACYTGTYRSDDDIRFALNKARCAVRAALKGVA